MVNSQRFNPGLINVAQSALFAAMLVFGGLAWCQAAEDKGTFPRLLGMNIGEKNYDSEAYQLRLARMDVVILGFYRGWNSSGQKNPIRTVVKRLKTLNPNILVGQYSILSEAYDEPGDAASLDIRGKLNNEGWWLRNAKGEKQRWTERFNTWDINITEWTKPDADGLRWPQWITRRDYSLFFGPVPEFGIWYFDGVNSHQRIHRADWDLDGRDDSGDDPRIQTAFRRGEVASWEAARKFLPNVILMGNVDNDLSYPEYRNRLQGAFLEGLMGYSWSIERWQGWQKMMDRYQSVFGNLLPPRIVGFNVSGGVDDYRFFRYAFTSCLMGDGYFSFTDESKGFSSVPWFDEYNAKLGRSVDPPQLTPWKEGVYRRTFENGMALVNPTIWPKSVPIEKGFRRISGRQAPGVNSGAVVDGRVIVPARDGLVLLRQ